jgi:hypothetical protein
MTSDIPPPSEVIHKHFHVPAIGVACDGQMLDQLINYTLKIAFKGRMTSS